MLDVPQIKAVDIGSNWLYLNLKALPQENIQGWCDCLKL